MLKPDEIKLREVIADNVEYYRKLNNLSQFQLTIDAEITRNQIGRIERMEINTTVLTLQKIANALKVDICQLLKERKTS